MRYPRRLGCDDDEYRRSFRFFCDLRSPGPQSCRFCGIEWSTLPVVSRLRNGGDTRRGGRGYKRCLGRERAGELGLRAPVEKRVEKSEARPPRNWFGSFFADAEAASRVQT